MNIDQRAFLKPASIGTMVFAFLGIIFLCWSLSNAQTLPHPSLQAYLGGLEDLRQGKYSEATNAFTQAMQGNPDPSFWLARGVAQCLNERLSEAVNDFNQARHMGIRGREAELWTYVAEMMGSGRSNRNPALSGGQGWFSGAPGHIIQGRDDYPTDYASFIYYEMATPYARGVTPAVREAMHEAGAWFANRAATRPDLAAAHLARVKTLYGQRDYAGALQEITYVRPLYPANPDVRYYAGAAWLALGRPATARRELTISLTGLTRSPGDYLERAYAAARLGDVVRAKSDFELASKYEAGVEAKYKNSIEQEVASNRVDGNPEQMLAVLEQKARSGATLESLITEAISLHKAMAPHRLRYDEWYQERMRQLEEAVRGAPKSAAPYVHLARFLIDESNLSYRGENIEPRHGLVPFRWQLSRESELRRAVSICEEALRVQPGNIPAQTMEATALVRLGDETTAEGIVNRVLAAAPRNPEALRLRAKFLVERASAMYARAAGLRAPRVESSSHTETRSDGVYRVTVTRYYPPTQEALNEAAQLDSQASALVRNSNAALSEALAVMRGTLEGDMLAAEINFALGRQDAAFGNLQNALKREPKSLEANDTLAEFYRRLGRDDESDRQMSVSTNLVQTNASWMLRIAWRKISSRDFAGARSALDAGRRLDPEDARVEAYTAVVLANTGNAPEANAFFRVALALDQARLRLDEGKEGTALPRDPEELALVMKLRNLLAAPLVDRQAQAALDYYGPSTVLARRITRAGRAAEMFGAMLPDPNAPAIPVPAPPNAAQLMAEAYNGAGRALKALGRTPEAMQEFQLAIDLTGKPGIPGVGSSRPGDTNFAGNANGGVAAEAFMEMVKTSLARGDCQAASQAMARGTEARFPPQMASEANKLQFEIARCFQQSSNRYHSR